MLRLFATFCFICLLLANPGFAARDHDITVDDYFTQAYINDCDLSPDGNYVVFQEMHWEGEKDSRNHDIWIVDTRSGETQRLTFDKTYDASPRFGRDSEWIYYTTSPDFGEEAPLPYDGSTQVWRMRRDGSGAVAITREEDGIGAFELSANGKALYYTVSTEGYEEDFKELREKYDDLTYGHGKNEYTKLMKLDLVSWRTEEIYDNDRFIEDFAVSHDEKQIALITNPTELLIHNEGKSIVEILTPATGHSFTLPDNLWRADAPSPYGWLEGLVWSKDGKKLAFRCDYDGFPAELFVAHFDTDETLVTKIVRPHEVSLGEDARMLWKGNSHDLCLGIIDHARFQLIVIPNITAAGQGKHSVMTPGDIAVETFDLADNGSSFAAIETSPTTGTDIYLYKSGNKRQLTHANPQMDSWKLPQTSIVSWTAPDGQMVEGILELPPDYKEGDGPLPLAMLIHGGPTSCEPYNFRYWIYGRTRLAARGWATLSPNYRGSTGYGDKFLTDLIGHENDIEVQDILSGVDAMVERGIADPEKLAVSGWSNGGYLTNCVITHTDRFKAASTGAGVIDMLMQWGIEDTPGHVINYMNGKYPWDGQTDYLKASPAWNMNKITTPTLIHVGAGDPRVPPAHSITLHRALKEYLNVPTELLMYPNQGHGLTKKNFRRAKIEWEDAWFNKYVLGEEEASEPERPNQ
ncbi:S9 family peptidase [bacterium]|nr:S9 family peptidase [bacterium]